MKLAEILREHPCIRKRSDSNYKKKVVRQDVFKSISNHFIPLDPRYSELEIERKIKNIICQFHRENKKRQQKSGAGGAEERFKSKWYHYNKLCTAPTPTATDIQRL